MFCLMKMLRKLSVFFVGGGVIFVWVFWLVGCPVVLGFVCFCFPSSPQFLEY